MIHYDDLTVEVVEDTYIVSAHGYQQRFEQLTDTIIRDTNGTEYSKVAASSSHESLQHLVDMEEEVRNKE